MAYCLRSFVETLDQVLNPHKHYKKWVLDHDHRPQIQSLFENATFLQHFLDHSSPQIQERIASLEDQIMDAAQNAADTLETIITDQILLNPKDQSFTIIPPDLGQVIRVFEDAKEEMSKIKNASQSWNNKVLPPVLKTHYPDSKMVVGVEEDLNQLRRRLTSPRVTELDIIPIVGMGGMGKTTLARILYDAFSLPSNTHFDCCAWVTVSQSYDPQLVLKTILACVTGKASSEIYHEETNELIVTLYQTLFSRRYLIVIDDIWSCKSWDDVHRAFPQDNQGSRIILTTRENTLVDYVKSNSHKMHLLTKEDSWELLRKIVFREDSCPREYEEVGKRIATNCGGLPLALQVIGGLLSRSERSEDFWRHVAHNISSLIAKTDDQFSGIFSWSFAHLPHYLKPCFLYMAAFPEDHVISASEIIKIWVAEGFLYPVQDKSLEEAAESHLNALVDRNLIFIRKRKINGKSKSYGMHDSLRDLCLRKAEEIKFLHVKEFSKINNIQEDTLVLSRFIVDTSHHDHDHDHDEDEGEDDEGIDNDEEHFLSLKFTSLARSFVLIGYATQKIMPCLSFKLSMLRVLDVLRVTFNELPETILQLVNLRYLAIGVQKDCHDNISVLQNLVTLIIDVMSIAVIVNLPQLRHIKISRTVHTNEFPYEKISDPHENLQSINNMQLEILLKLRGKLPNLRKLGFYCSSGSFENADLTSFHKLETLKIWNGFNIRSGTLISNVIFPDSLNKLSLWCCGVPQSLLDTIGVLPNLQILKFSSCGFESTTWEPTEGEFCELQYLQFTATNLENLLAADFHFPALRHLVFDQSTVINDIPNDIGGIETLEIIEVDRCRPCVFDSAVRILEEQRMLGNDVLQLRLGKTRELVRERAGLMREHVVPYKHKGSTSY